MGQSLPGPARMRPEAPRTALFGHISCQTGAWHTVVRNWCGRHTLRRPPEPQQPSLLPRHFPKARDLIRIRRELQVLVRDVIRGEGIKRHRVGTLVHQLKAALVGLLAYLWVDAGVAFLEELDHLRVLGHVVVDAFEIGRRTSGNVVDAE